ncbi:MAG: hypothetical protein ABS45_00365 [Comamonas sp. SCN 65-56]|mgnify:CR=1 FL=1|uniref:hypothetical protein n=1 Tax=Comamonas sp. SCN 65-56 TaxID=1660095 RepID=UPI00086E9BA4|nr:hypothetical protein [Comamonas sp. SCN 65-56]ODS93855.1 MAG: hypothetical protein ABS45_00365 [Comamonas sp. SCN 65-56]
MQAQANTAHDHDPLLPLIQRLEHLLHDLDPMGTCCRLNLDMEDEYECEAPHIARLLSTGVPLRDAVCQVFDAWFWEDCLQTKWGEEGLSALIANLDDSLQRPSSAQNQMLALHEMLFQNILPDLFTEESGWTYASFMQTAPELLNPAAYEGFIMIRVGVPIINLDDAEEETSDEDEQDSTEPPQMPRPGEPDTDNLLPWLHALLFEKTRRRTPPEQLLTYEQFLQQVRARIGA